MLPYKLSVLVNDKSIKPIILTVSLLPFENCRLVSIVDITQRKKNEMALKEHRDHLETVVEERTQDLMLSHRDLEEEIQLRVKVEAALMKCLKYDKALSKCSRILLNDSENALNDVLKIVIKTMGVCRAVFITAIESESYGTCFSLVGEICKPGILSITGQQELNVFSVSARGFDEWVERFKKGDPVFKDTTSFSAAEKSVFDQLHTKSVLAVPVSIQNVWNGFLGLDDTIKNREWEEQDIRFQQNIAEMLGVSLFRKKYEEALKQAKEEAEAANRIKSEFIANISHEIRTPLNAINGFSEILSSMITTPNERSYLNAVRTAGKSLLMLINDILDLSKIEASKMEIQKAPVNVTEVLQDIKRIFELTVSEKGLEFSIDVDPMMPSVLVLDESRVRQILLNLVGNAVKFTDSGYICLTVKWDNAENMLAIDVKDTGSGIPERDLKRVFGSFMQKEKQETKKFGGTGLGLTITKKLIELMDGELTLSSIEGKGSTFSITIRHVDISELDMKPEERKPIDIKTVQFAPAKVLAVDDVKTNLFLLKAVLSKINLKIAMAENGQEAVMLASELRPDLILMDIRMPVMDGIEALMALKKNPHTVDIPVIALTASPSWSDKQKMLDVGFSGYVAKPIDLKLLYAELENHLKRIDCSDRKPRDIKRPLPDSIRSCKETAVDHIFKEIQEYISPCLEQNTGAVKISDVRRLGEKIYSIGKSYDISELSEYATMLLEQEKNMDILGIETSIMEFQKLCNEVVEK